MSDHIPHDLMIPTTSKSSNFPQAGQLDWVALLQTSVSYPLEVCVRLQNADVNPVTVGVGNLICSTFAFPPEGQRELNDSLSLLKGSSRLSKALWFGFGVQHLVRNLSGSEQGAFLVAICAALTIKYSTFEAAQILRELCSALKAPQHVTPSIHQWSNLAEVCSGSLTRSRFLNYFDSFNRLLTQRHVSKLPTAPSDVARGLITLSEISRKPSVRVTFVGGMDCAWLAAVAQCLLHLNIEIRDSHGTCSFQTQRVGVVAQPQVVFVCDAGQVEVAASRSLSNRLIFVSSGEDLLQERVDFGNCLYCGPSRWSTIFSDTFPEWSEFSQPSLAVPFCTLLRHVSIHSQQYHSVGSSAVKEVELLPFLKWKGQGCLYHPKRTGEKLLRFAHELLPELAILERKSARNVSNVGDHSSKIFDCLDHISRVCSCSQCQVHIRKASHTGSTRGLCLTRIAMTVIRFILILSPTNINEHLYPSVSALKQLYNCTSRDPKMISAVPVSCHGLMLVLFLFTGRLPLAHSNLRVSAASFGGVCAFYGILKDSQLPITDAMMIEVIPGHIQHQERMYHFIKDLDTNFLVSNAVPDANASFLDIGHKKFELVIEEVEDSKTLAASYRVYEDYTNWSFIGIESLMEAVRSSIRSTTSHSVHHQDSFSLPSTGKSWALRLISTDTEASPDDIDGMASCSMPEDRWSIVTWDSWKSNNSRDGVHQMLDVEYYSAPVELFHLLVMQLYKNSAHVPFWDRRSRLVVLQMGGCPCCIAMTVSHLWLELDAFPNSRAVKFDEHRKQGVMKRHCYETETRHKETNFDLIPIKYELGLITSPKRFWHFSGRGVKA